MLGPELDANPTLANSMHDALTYYRQASEQATQTRTHNLHWKDKTRDELKDEVSAEAREQGRKEAFDQFTDRLGTIKSPTGK